MDDVGLRLAQRTSRFAQRIGRGLVAGMPKLLAALSTVGTVAMLWVGGHILLVGSRRARLACALRPGAPRRGVRARRGGIGGVLAWLVNTAASALIGLIVGAVVVAIMHVLPFGKKDKH